MSRMIARRRLGRSAFTHEPLLVRDYRGCERHRSGRTVDTLKAGMIEAALQRPVDPDHLPNARRPATRPDDAIALPSFDLAACNHDVPCREGPAGKLGSGIVACSAALSAII